jgi:hypothetical protein
MYTKVFDIVRRYMHIIPKYRYRWMMLKVFLQSIIFKNRAVSFPLECIRDKNNITRIIIIRKIIAIVFTNRNEINNLKILI